MISSLGLVAFFSWALQAEPLRAYISPDSPPVRLPAPSGEFRDVTLPDTLDIVAMAELAVRALTSPLDPEDDDSLYWLVDFRTVPPVMTKEDWPNIAAKFQEALPLLRTMTGSDLNVTVDDED